MTAPVFDPWSPAHRVDRRSFWNDAPDVVARTWPWLELASDESELSWAPDFLL